MVGAGGLDPPLLSELEPKSSVSAISPCARKKKYKPTSPSRKRRPVLEGIEPLLRLSGSLFGYRGVRKHVRLPGGDTRRLHYLLREALGPFHPCARSDRTEGLYARRLKRIDKTCAKRSFGANHDKIGGILLAPGRYSGDIRRLKRQAFRDLRHARISGCAPKLMFLRILRQTPRDRVFAPATSNYQNFHACYYIAKRP